MDRRLILTSGLALLAVPAMAQTNPAPPTDAPAASSPQPAAATPAPAPAMKMATPMLPSDATTAHMKETLRVGTVSLALSRAVAAKVTAPRLKQFVAFEISEQETIADILKTAMMPDAMPSGTVKAPTDAEVMQNLDAEGRQAVTKMHEMKPGKALERDYIKAQIEGHKALLIIQETYLKTPDNHDEANVAKLAKGMITEHLVLLSDLEKELG